MTPEQLAALRNKKRLGIGEMSAEPFAPAIAAHPTVTAGLAETEGARNGAGRVPTRKDPADEFALMVARGLSEHPRQLDSRFLYDRDGSQIFEQICEQPEYYLTRTESAILSSAAAGIAAMTGPVTLVEFGSGSSIKTRLLLDAYCGLYGGSVYAPVDISETILKQAQREIASSYPSVNVLPLHGTYEEAYPMLGTVSPSMLLFLGSTVGNLDSHAASLFWENISHNLSPGDHCLLGVDINEDTGELHAAYNDEAGLSEAFTRNLFHRINRELGASLDIGAIRHVARYNQQWRRVEIFARFEREQEVHIRQLGGSFTIGEGELILTEVSRKFRLSQLVPYLGTFDLQTQRVFSDSARRFAVLLLSRK